jgi:hypothetical protein
LDGFVFDHLGVNYTTGKDDIRHRPIAWWADWFKRDPEYSPQPYTQLATLFRSVGRLSDGTIFSTSAANGNANLFVRPETSAVVLR